MAGGGNGTDRHSESASGVPPFGNPFRSAGTCSTDTVAHSENSTIRCKTLRHSGSRSFVEAARAQMLFEGLNPREDTSTTGTLRHTAYEPCAYRDAATTPELRRAFWPT